MYSKGLGPFTCRINSVQVLQLGPQSSETQVYTVTNIFLVSLITLYMTNAL